MIFLIVLSCVFTASLDAALEGTYNWKAIPEFSMVPAADEEGIVIDAHVINFPDGNRRYNPSIIRESNGFLLATRQDLPGTAWPISHSIISLWSLNESFQLQDGGTILQLLDNHSEDPRLFYSNGSICLLYVHVNDPRAEWKCSQAIAKIGAKKRKVFQVEDLTFSEMASREKNWTPLSYEGETGEESLYFLYSYNPLKVLQLKDSLDCIYTGKENCLLTRWEQKWGKIRGGTPAIRINDDEYIAFFHSTFWQYVRYVMGAALIEAHPPFRIKKISPYPIIFKGAYDTPPLKSQQTVLFPGGIVEDSVDGREVFQVACGENDNAVKIVTIDKAALLKSLVYEK